MYCARIKSSGAAGVVGKPIVVDRCGDFGLTYVPFEFSNALASLVLVSTTPGYTHVKLAAAVTEALLRDGAPGAVIQRENKRQVELGGSWVRPNLIRMLDRFGVPGLIGVPTAASLWEAHFAQLHSLPLLPYAATKNGLPFSGPFEELLRTPLLRSVYDSFFLKPLREMNADALYLAVGRTAWDGLRHAYARGVVRDRQLLGMVPVPVRAGSMTNYFVGEVTDRQLSKSDPVRHRIVWLDSARRELMARLQRHRARSQESVAPHPALKSVSQESMDSPVAARRSGS